MRHVGYSAQFCADAQFADETLDGAVDNYIAARECFYNIGSPTWLERLTKSHLTMNIRQKREAYESALRRLRNAASRG